MFRGVKKKFDAVKFMREQRQRIAEKIKNMTPEQEIEYFRKKSEEFRNPSDQKK
jgi:hypothetical protein